MSDHRPFADQFPDPSDELDTLAEEEMKVCHDRGFHRPEKREVLTRTDGGGPIYVWLCSDCGETLYDIAELPE